MEPKRCRICTTEIEQYPCPLCGYNGELEQAAPRQTAQVPEEEIVIEKLHRVNTKKQTAGKKKQKHGGIVRWLVGLLIVLLLAAIGWIFLNVHVWQEATCTAPETCRICRRQRGEPLPHSFDGSCLIPGKCTVCGAVQEEAPGHSWVRSDCLTAGTCSVCGAPEPEAPGHDWAAADCENPEHCTRCDAASGNPLGHSWDGVTEPAECARCGIALSEEQKTECLLAAASRAVFDGLFADPDWQNIYRTAQITDIPFESPEQYAVYMSAYNALTPELRELPRSEGAAPGYEVLMGQDPIASFTLRRNAAGWELDALELFIERTFSVTVQTQDGCTVSINGTALDEKYLISRAASPAAAFLPEGTPGLQTCVWQVTGLIAEPAVEVSDADGNALRVVSDESTGIYRTEGADSEITEEEKTVVFAALESYSEFMINASGARNRVVKYFENGTQTCKNILQMGSELWMNSDRGHKFREETILGFQRYSESLFAVRVSVIMETSLKYGGSRDYTIAQTMFFRLKNDKWVCFAMTNQDVLTPEVTAPEAEETDEWADCPDGIRIEEYSGPYFNAHIMLVRDPSRVYLGLSSYRGFSLNTAGKRLTEAIVDEDAVAAINAGAFYDDGTSNTCVGSTPAGLTIYDGKMVSNVYPGLVPEKGFCGLDADGHLVVAESMTEAKAAELNIRYGCEFGPVLIQDSKINEEAYAKGGYNPRTAVGQRADGTLIFVCADGRQAGSLGATYGELIDLLVKYGAVNACNMDGGSSTVMLTRNAEGEVNFVNCYSVLQTEPRRMPTFWLIRP